MRPWPWRLARGLLLALGAAGCPGEVIVLESSEAPAANQDTAAPSEPGADAAGCSACTQGDWCGLCESFEGPPAHLCRHGDRPRGNCHHDGSLHADEQGFYVCWYCPP
jgi:hypothetical protein